MAVVETVARVQVGSGAHVERLVCHPRLPLVAGLDSERPAVRVWDCGAGKLHELGIVGADSTAHGDAAGWERTGRTPSTAWHPDQPLLLVAGGGKVVRWTVAGLSELESVPPTADVLTGSPVTGLGATATGELVVASGGGDLRLLSVFAGSATARAAAGETMRSIATAFLDATSEVPDDGDMEAHLVVTDGARTWDGDDLATVATATATDPTWL